MSLKSWILRRDWFNIMGYAALIGLWADSIAAYYNIYATLLSIDGQFQLSIFWMYIARDFIIASEFYGWISVIALAFVCYKTIQKQQIKSVLKKYHIDTI